MIVSRFDNQNDPHAKASRAITGGPLYPRDEILDLVRNHVNVTPVTEKAIKDVQNLCLDNPGLLDLLADCVTSGRFIGSEWCEIGSSGALAACDAYHLCRREWNQYAHKELPVEYYVKFCIGKTGQVVLLISCHPPEDKRRHK